MGRNGSEGRNGVQVDAGIHVGERIKLVLAVGLGGGHGSGWNRLADSRGARHAVMAKWPRSPQVGSELPGAYAPFFPPPHTPKATFINDTCSTYLSDGFTLRRAILTHVFCAAVNTSGVPRLTKFYTPPQHSAQTLVQKIFGLIATRQASLCNFLDAPELETFLHPSDDGEKLRVVYRNYATLYFVFVVDAAESELGILDLIQVRAGVGACADRLSCVARVGVCGVAGPRF